MRKLILIFLLSIMAGGCGTVYTSKKAMTYGYGYNLKQVGKFEALAYDVRLLSSFSALQKYHGWYVWFGAIPLVIDIPISIVTDLITLPVHPISTEIITNKFQGMSEDTIKGKKFIRPYCVSKEIAWSFSEISYQVYQHSMLYAFLYVPATIGIATVPFFETFFVPVQIED